MTIYSQAAIEAHQLITQSHILPLAAWEKAIPKFTTSHASQVKGCPRETFLGLAYAGYLIDIKGDDTKPLSGVLRDRAVKAADYINNKPDATKKELATYLDYDDKQGAYDIILSLKASGVLVAPNK